MKSLKTLLLCLALPLSLAAGNAFAQGDGKAGADETLATLSQKPYIYEVLRYLNRWYLDEADAQKAVKGKNLTVWIAKEDHALDKGDKSLFGKIYFPLHSMVVRVKKCDYSIPEMGAEAKSATFKVVNVEHMELPSEPPQGCVTLECDMKELLDYMFSTRDQREYPNETLLARLRLALKKEIDKAKKLMDVRSKHAEQIIHLAPLSPVANETWAYLENGNLLVRFSSDIDMANPAVWENETLMVQVYDILEQVILSRDEAPGSNRFLTRAEASRLLFNCMVFGQRITLRPEKRQE